jgi:type II secretory pathway pseudopilin PulG
VVELIIVVAVLAILAAVAIPAFFGASNKQKAQAEIQIMFAELREKAERFKSDNTDASVNPIGAYLPAAACPPAPSHPAQDATACVAAGMPWQKMAVNLVRKNLHCSYAITTGLKGVPPAPPAPFTMPTPAVSWYFIVATCDFSPNAGFSTYFVNSVDGNVQSINEGD